MRRRTRAGTSGEPATTSATTNGEVGDDLGGATGARPATRRPCGRRSRSRGPPRIHLRHRMGLRTRITLLFPALTLVLTSLVSMGVYQVVRTSQLSSGSPTPAPAPSSTPASCRSASASRTTPTSTWAGSSTPSSAPRAASRACSTSGRRGRASPTGTPATPPRWRRATCRPRWSRRCGTDASRSSSASSCRATSRSSRSGVPIGSVGASYFELTPLDDLQKTLDNLAVALPGAVLLTTIVAFLLGNWVARAALAPLGDVSQAAEAIAADRLDTRLPPSTDPELTGLVTSFNNMVEALQRRIDRDARFASDVSHELRSPLMTLSASVEVLQRRRDELSVRAAAALDLLADDVIRFQNLVGRPAGDLPLRLRRPGAGARPRCWSASSWNGPCPTSPGARSAVDRAARRREPRRGGGQAPPRAGDQEPLRQRREVRAVGSAP